MTRYRAVKDPNGATSARNFNSGRARPWLLIRPPCEISIQMFERDVLTTTFELLAYARPSRTG
jgi:hypothetical protein